MVNWERRESSSEKVCADFYPFAVVPGGNGQCVPSAVNALIVDFLAGYHGGASGISFADGHAEIHKWIGSKIRMRVIGNYSTKVPCGDSLNDLRWLSDNTTVR